MGYRLKKNLTRRKKSIADVVNFSCVSTSDFILGDFNISPYLYW